MCVSFIPGQLGINARISRFLFCLSALLLAFVGDISAQDAYRSPTLLKKLPLEELLDLQITSASRRPELLSQAASAIDVVTAEEILRSGATTIPDALRLAAGLHVAQVTGSNWAISARGFNNGTANKMQVVMDGRNLYTPLFSGVFWDVQHTFLPDLAQIEVIRGPGATLWGANAVNGVINIKTRSAKETQGTLVYGGGGNVEHGFGGVRYGGKIGDSTYYRAYVMHQSRDSLVLQNGADSRDETDFTQAGFRVDSELSSSDALTIQGDAYRGRFGQFVAPGIEPPDTEVAGGNVIARWSRQFGPDSNVSVQAYFDRTHRLNPGSFEEDRTTFDAELEHRLPFGDRHEIVYGANYRISADEIGNIGPSLAFLPDEETVHLVSGYVQDTYQLVPDKLSITAGTKLEYNSFSDFEVQPSGRFAWNPTNTQTVWGAISRAVRTPSRIDQDLISPNPSSGGPAVLLSNPGFESEVLIAYELGYRIMPVDTLSLDLALYYHDYENLRSVEPQGPGGTPPLRLENKLEGTAYGGTLGAKWRVTDWWSLDGSVSLLAVDVHRGPGSLDTNFGRGEGNDPNQIFHLRSSLDLPHNIQFDAVLRYVGDLPNPATQEYIELDLRVAWSPLKNFEVAIVGRNLLDESHPEFQRTTLSREVSRSIFGTIKWSF